MSLEIIESVKYKGIPFHDLNVQDQDFINNLIDENIIEKPKSLFSCERNYELLNFFKKVTNTFYKDTDEIYLSIDSNNIDYVLVEIRKKIDDLLKSSNVYDPDTFGDYSDLHSFSKIHNEIKNFKDTKNLNESYIVIYAFW